MTTRHHSQSRRPFGRPKDAPGPVKTFEDSFQISPAAEPHSGGSHQGVLQLSQGGQFVSLPATRRPRRSPVRGQGAGRAESAGRGEGAGRSQHGGRRPSGGAHDAASTAPTPARLARGTMLAPPTLALTRQADDVSTVTRMREADDVPTEAGPPKRRRSSIAAPAGSGGHRQTRSTPAVPIIAHPGGSNFHRSNSSSVLPRMHLDGGGGRSLAGPRSWPRTLAQSPTLGPQYHQVRTNALSPMSPISPVAYPGGDHLTPSTPGSGGQYSPQGLLSLNLADTPSTASLPLTPSRQHYPRTASNELPDLSPTYPGHWQSPSSAPHTPGSLREHSLPPSSATPSPFIGAAEDFEFDVFPTYGAVGEHPATLSGSRAVSDHQYLQDPSELPPLPTDQFPVDMMFSGNSVYQHPSAMAATTMRPPQESVYVYGQHVPSASMSGTPRPPHPLMNPQGLPAEAAAPDLSQGQELFFPRGLFDNTAEPVFAFSGQQQEVYAPPDAGYMHAPHSAPGSSGSGYYPVPAAHAYPSQAGPSHMPSAGPSYTAEGGASYASQAGPSYSSQAGALYSSHLGPPYSPHANRYPGH